MNIINPNFAAHGRITKPASGKPHVVPLPNPMASAEQVVQKLKKNIAETKENIKQIQKVSDIILGRKTQFSVDQESGKVIVAIVDPQTNQVIKEIPSAEELRMKAKLRSIAENSVTGTIVNLKI
ncbi:MULTISPECIES: flagellar protein FlaG [Treponema]|jgi:flagellar protein FlaG|uniref:Flagellar protein FlaG protein n=1 Tax=Treponema saccharophilum DSM 2985 TaxID=907348 RepID=H7ENU9_9SPIR|nr:MULTISPECIES: flagellar protein FlaG [Treponema]EIC00582.1 flagellar protein FlaG protein [Treponema saccharophilum DSM 2985]MBQ5537948.1 flagellar protein FlaG [Treponema sp.]BDC95670.1 hypothetical protein TRSA_07690 [Treponema saccharophilum]